MPTLFYFLCDNFSMIKIGITGNIACGKTTAYKIIKSAEHTIIDADDIVKELYKNNLFIEELSKKFTMIISDGKINFKILSGLLFTDKDFKEKYEAFIFPKVKEKIIEFFEANKNTKKVFVIVPLLFEAKMKDIFDNIIFISADENIRRKRLISRNSMLSNIADKVIKSQISEEEKIPHSDYIIKNNGTIEEFKNAVNILLNNI